MPAAALTPRVTRGVRAWAEPRRPGLRGGRFDFPLLRKEVERHGLDKGAEELLGGFGLLDSLEFFRSSQSGHRGSLKLGNL
jgi:hypothetical protein